MNKFVKRLTKMSKHHDHALVVGYGFGNLEEILSVYKNVFLINDCPSTIKSKNLVYRQDSSNLNQMAGINAVIFDLEKIHQLSTYKELWQRNKSVVIIEGDEPIGREYSKSLYETGWGCTSKHGFFHVWEQIK